MDNYSVIKKPVITEKSAILADESKYTFIVDSNSNKIQIKNAFKDIYGVSPKEVKIIITKAKSTARRGLKRRPKKKAVIILKKGESIDLSKIK
jgi:large subunit ribosomal protein L23